LDISSSFLQSTPCIQTCLSFLTTKKSACKNEFQWFKQRITHRFWGQAVRKQGAQEVHFNKIDASFVRFFQPMAVVVGKTNAHRK